MTKLARYLVTLLITTLPVIAEAQPTNADLDSSPVVTKRPRKTARAATSWDNLIDTGLTPAVTWGLSLPVSRFGFTHNSDGTYGGNVTPIQPGVGVSLYWNLVRGTSGTAPVALATTLFGATDVSSKQSDAGLGIAVGPSFFNNTFGIQLGVDLYRRIGDKDTGALMTSAGGQNGFSRENVFVLFNFGIGLGKSAPGALKIAP